MVIRIGSQLFLAHRLAWLYTHGRWPEKHLDHINRNPGDNRISNLREVDHTTNSWNENPRSNNTSGYKGVYFHKRWGKWVARSKNRRQPVYLGAFDNLLDAARAYDVYVLKERGPYAVTNFDPIEYL